LGEASKSAAARKPGRRSKGICPVDGSGLDVHVVRPLWRPISSWNHQCGPPRHSDSYRPMTPPATPLTLERRLALLREISEGRTTLHAGPSATARAVLAAKLAEWQQLVRLDDIRVRTLHEITVAGEELLLAAAALTTSGLKFLEEHGGERGERG
jgi:hypothetical protein